MMTTAIALTLAAYLLLLWAMSAIASRRAGNADYFVGSQRASWLVTLLSMVSAAMSGVTFISVPGMVLSEQFTYLQMFVGFAIGYAVIAFVLVPIYYRTASPSIYGYFEERFGSEVRTMSALMFVVAKLTGAAIRLYVICLVMQQLLFAALGIPFWVTVAAAVAYSAAYTFRGGVKAVIWCDALKSVAMLSSIVWCILLFARGCGLSLGEAWEWCCASDYSTVWCFDAASPRYIVKQILGGLFIVVATTGIDQDIMQRTIASSRQRDAQRNLVVAIILQTLIVAALLWLGALMYRYTEAVGITAAGDGLFAAAATSEGMPIVVAILFTLGVTSATFSASGSALTALTTSVTLDIFKGGSRDEKSLMQLRHRINGALAVAMFVVICITHRLSNSSIIDTVYRLASYTYGPILGLFLFGILTRRRLTRTAAITACTAAPLICAMLDICSAAWFDGYRFGYELLGINAGITFIGLLLGSLLRKKD